MGEPLKSNGSPVPGGEELEPATLTDEGEGALVQLSRLNLKWYVKEKKAKILKKRIKKL